MNLPLPETRRSQGKPSNLLMSLAMSLWILVVVSVIAGLIFQIGVIHDEKQVARRDSQKAEAALAPALKLYNQWETRDREENLRQALEIIDKDVLKADPTHLVALSTKHLIEEELRGMKNATIDQQKREIQEGVRTLEQANREIERLNATIAGLHRDKDRLQQNISSLSQTVSDLQSDLREAQRAGAQGANEANAQQQKISDLLREIQNLRNQQGRNSQSPIRDAILQQILR